MANIGFSPPTRVFEAAGAGGCLITDNWPGIDEFFAPQKEILIASSAEEILDHLRNRSADECRAIGAAMKSRALHQHTYELRVNTVDSILKSNKQDTHQRDERAVPA
jgi:spore maturation protein CgeB